MDRRTTQVPKALKVKRDLLESENEGVLRMLRTVLVEVVQKGDQNSVSSAGVLGRKEKDSGAKRVGRHAGV